MCVFVCIYIYIYIYIYILFDFYTNSIIPTVWKNIDGTICKYKKYHTNWYLGKKFDKKEKKLKTFILFEKNQPIMYALSKEEKTNRIL